MLVQRQRRPMMTAASLLTMVLFGLPLPQLGSSEGDLKRAGFCNTHTDSVDSMQFARVAFSRSIGKVRLSATIVDGHVHSLSVACVGGRRCAAAPPSVDSHKCEVLSRSSWRCSEGRLKFDIHSCGGVAYLVTEQDATFSRGACASLGIHVGR